MSCTQTLSDINVNCGSNRGGIREVMAQNRSAITGITLTDGVVTAFTMATGAPQAAKFMFKPQSSVLNSTWNIDEAAGSKGVSSELQMRFSKMETAKRTSIVAMANAEMYVIVKDVNGKYWLLGYDDPVTLTAGGGTSGTTFTDTNEYTVTLGDQSEALPYEVSASAVETFFNEQVTP